MTNSNSADDANGQHDNQLTRRRSIQLGAATVAGSVLGSAVVGTAAAQEYDEIQANGQSIFVDSNETWENKLIDMSTGNDIVISAKGTNWTIRNIGIQGLQTSDKGRTYFGVADTGGNTSVMENIYIGDGTTDGNQQPSGHGTSGIWVDPDHNGHLDIKHVNVQGMADNGIYGSAPGSNSNGQRGTVHIDSCYASNCHVSQFRLADGCMISNSVAFNDGSFEYNGRCFWGWPTEAGNRMEIVDCDFDSGTYPDAIYLGRSGRTTLAALEGTHHDGISTRGNTDIDWRGGNGSNPDLSIPEGVPTSAEEAASGGGSSPPSDPDPGEFTYSVEANENDVEYYLEARDGVDWERDGAAGVTWVDADRTRVAGRIDVGEGHTWIGLDDPPSGDSMMLDVTIDGDGDAYIDGEESALGWYPRPDATGDHWKELYTYSVEANENDVEYYLEARDGVDWTPTGDYDVTWVDDDQTRVAGHIDAGETHTWAGLNDPPSGDSMMLDVTIDGDGDAYIDGEESSLSWYPRPDATGDHWKDLDDLLDDS